MSNAQKPIVGIGTEFPAGTVVAIKHDHVLLETPSEGVKKFSFSQIERFINVERTLSQA
tara:strand:+ start:468 stop:644 length:177 start_codon:yes stop_codon:yes gene_type:complete